MWWNREASEKVGEREMLEGPKEPLLASMTAVKGHKPRSASSLGEAGKGNKVDSCLKSPKEIQPC